MFPTIYFFILSNYCLLLDILILLVLHLNKFIGTTWRCCTVLLIEVVGFLFFLYLWSFKLGFQISLYLKWRLDPRVINIFTIHMLNRVYVETLTNYNLLHLFLLMNLISDNSVNVLQEFRINRLSTFLDALESINTACSLIETQNWFSRRRIYSKQLGSFIYLNSLYIDEVDQGFAFIVIYNVVLSSSFTFLLLSFYVEMVGIHYIY